MIPAKHANAIALRETSSAQTACCCVHTAVEFAERHAPAGLYVVQRHALREICRVARKVLTQEPSPISAHERRLARYVSASSHDVHIHPYALAHCASCEPK
jgi:hypothetical protein